MRRRATILLLLATALLAVACTRSPQGGTVETPDPQSLILNQGYSMLHADASSIGKVDLVLYVKFESEDVDHVVTDLSAYGGELKQQLERVAREYPRVRIDLSPLPEMEVRKRAAVGRDKALRFAPLSGRSRQDYERTLLIGLSNGINHESHLCGVMAEEEPDAGLKKILQACQKAYDGFYERMTAMLEHDYYTQPASGAHKKS